MRVLVIEDDAVIRGVLSEYLHDVGHEVHVAADGNTALVALARRRPDVIVLDLMLAGMDGWQLVETLRTQTRWSQIPIVAASAVHDLPTQAARLGVRGSLAKPLDFDKLAAEIERVGPHPSEVQATR
jgi:CheY-like chemotaxis protein